MQERAVKKRTEQGKIRMKKTPEEIMEDYRSGDEERRQQAMVDMYHYLYGYIVSMIGKKSTYTNDFDDIMSECKCQIIEAMEKYRPEKSSPSTYFTYTIHHAISSYKSRKLNNSTTHFSNGANKVRTAIKELEAKGITPTVPAIAIQAGLNVKQVETGLAIIRGADERSFESSDVFDAVVGPIVESTEAEFFKKMNSEVFDRVFSKLDQDNLRIFCMFHGVYGRPMSYTEISKIYGTNVKEISIRVEKTRRRLYMNKEIRSYFGKQIGYTGKDEIISVSVTNSDDAVSAVMDDFLDGEDDEDFDIF